MELNALGRMHLEHQEQEGGMKATLAEQVDLNTTGFVNQGKSYKSQSFLVSYLLPQNFYLASVRDLMSNLIRIEKEVLNIYLWSVS